MLSYLKHGGVLYIGPGEAYVNSLKYPVDYDEATEMAEGLVFLGSTDKGFKAFKYEPNGSLCAWQIRKIKEEALLGEEAEYLANKYKVNVEEIMKIARKEITLNKVLWLRQEADRLTQLADKLETTC